jgi:uncharacterized protein YbaR (Trm112 family)
MSATEWYACPVCKQPGLRLNEDGTLNIHGFVGGPYCTNTDPQL